MRRLSTELRIRDVELLVAAVLHDVLEDTDCAVEELAQRFGPRALGLVRELTLPPAVHGPSVPDETKTQAILRSLEVMTWEAVLIKLCDRIDNLGDIEFTPWTDAKRENYRTGSLCMVESVERRLAQERPDGLIADATALALVQLRRAAAPLARVD